MAHKKKGGKKSAPHSPTQANDTNGKEAPPATFKEAILKGTSQELTGKLMSSYIPHKVIKEPGQHEGEEAMTARSSNIL